MSFNTQVFKNKFSIAVLALLLISCNENTGHQPKNILTSSSVLMISKTVQLSSKISGEYNSDIEAIKSVIVESTKAMNEENLEAVLATTDETSPEFQLIKQVMPYLFKTYDLKHEIHNIKVVEILEDKATLTATEITKKINGPTFRNNKLLAIYTLKKSDGKWRIYSTKIENFEYLN